MKKIITFIIIIMSVLICSCVDGYSIFNKDSPVNYNGSKWVSDNPDMWFTVEVIVDEYAARTQTVYSPTYNLFGELNYDGQVYKITCDFDGDVFVITSAFDGETELLLDGSFLCDSEKCTLTINTNWNDFFNGKYEKITFYREK